MKKKNYEKNPIILKSYNKKIKILKYFLTMLPLFGGSRKNIYQKGFYYLQNLKKLRPPKRGNALKNEKNQIIKIGTFMLIKK